MKTHLLNQEDAKADIYKAVYWLAKCLRALEKKAAPNEKVPGIISQFEIKGEVFELSLTRVK